MMWQKPSPLRLYWIWFSGIISSGCWNYHQSDKSDGRGWSIL